MKISQMLKREDFYTINQKTLDSYYLEQQGSTELFVYPLLNAIVTRHPSCKVKNYLLCEYAMETGSLKGFAVKFYVRLCLSTAGLLAAKRLRVNASVSKNTLIYPCNKKYRIFDFSADVVDVIVKNQFKKDDLTHEILFRNQKDLPSFVPPLITVLNDGYREQIIQGKPLARIYDQFDNFCHQAYDQLCEFRGRQIRQVSGKEYAEYLYKTSMEKVTEKVRDRKTFYRVVKVLAEQITRIDQLTLCFSHGDLQAGNIWIEDYTNKVYIIDWESWGERSVWYDKAVLFDRLRPGSVDHYLAKRLDEREKYTVLLEDIQFHLTELNSLPNDFGVEQFESYIQTVSDWLQ